MKILHAADIHLDSPMAGLAAYENALVSELQLATRHALSNLVEFALEEQVDLLLLAGDISSRARASAASARVVLP